MNPPPYGIDDPEDEFQGDVHAADIVAPTGEEMPIATHAEVHRTPEPRALEAPSHRATGRD
jgi:hypothetical protein